MKDAREFAARCFAASSRGYAKLVEFSERGGNLALQTTLKFHQLAGRCGGTARTAIDAHGGGPAEGPGDPARAEARVENSAPPDDGAGARSARPTTTAGATQLPRLERLRKRHRDNEG